MGDVEGTPLRHSLYVHAPYVFLVGLYVVSGLLVFPRLGRSIPYSFTDIYRSPVLFTGLYLFGTLLLAIAIDILAARRPPFETQTWRILTDRWFGTRRLLGTLIVLATLPALFDIMLGYRVSLTELRPFGYDRAFMALDRWLHFGSAPWELLQPMIGHPAATLLIDRFYVFGWFFLQWTVLIWQIVHGRPPVRLQFLLSFTLAWILLGTVAAIVFSSAGPAYYGRVTGLADPYQPLFAYLHSVHDVTRLNALANQQLLGVSYRTWGGITAMPSMHMAITTIIALSAVRTIPRLIWIIAPMWLLMLIGSVHLGWHYAVDSYAGILGAGLIWIACGYFSRWWLARHDSRAPFSSTLWNRGRAR